MAHKGMYDMFKELGRCQAIEDDGSEVTKAPLIHHEPHMLEDFSEHNYDDDTTDLGNDIVTCNNEEAPVFLPQVVPRDEILCRKEL